jgi:hypothetical protein
MLPVTPIALDPGRVGWPSGSKQIEKLGSADQPMPFRPVAHGGMSEAQRIDLEAAILGKITWAEYFRKWGRSGPSL